MAVDVVRAERVLPARQADVWAVVTSSSMLAAWLFRVDDAGEWAVDGRDLSRGTPIDHTSLFDAIAPFRWIRYRSAKHHHFVVVEVIDHLDFRHIEWTDVLVADQNGALRPTRSRCRFKIALEPSAGDTRVRLSLGRDPESFWDRLRYSFERRTITTNLAESLVVLEELLLYR
jgi:uncharacterized protein YndB with AHSA1/START domain